MRLMTQCSSRLVLLTACRREAERGASSTCFCLPMAVFTISIPRLERLPSRVSLKSSATDLCLDLAVNGEAKPWLFVYPSMSPEDFRHRRHVAPTSAADDYPPYWITRGSRDADMTWARHLRFPFIRLRSWLLVLWKSFVEEEDRMSKLVTWRTVRFQNKRDAHKTRLPCLYFYQWNLPVFCFTKTPLRGVAWDSC